MGMSDEKSCEVELIEEPDDSAGSFSFFKEATLLHRCFLNDTDR